MAGRNNGYISADPQLASDPSAPDSGFAIMYPKIDGNFYAKWPDGRTRQVMSVSSGTTAPTSPAIGEFWIDTN